MNKRWRLNVSDKEKVDALFQQLHISPILCSILVQRGIETFNQAKSFFRPELSDLHDPFLMKDMQKAVDRILEAFAQNEKILVFGDYDVDGTTAVACMYKFLKQHHPNSDFYIPHRYREGYGVSKAGIDYAAENGFTLIISLDCGIKSVELIRYAKQLNIDFVVCDHHLPDPELPPAVAILNPKQTDCSYPYKELCGCGVGFKLITALCKALGLPETVAHEYLDLVATAIAADIVPITSENRVLAFYGLKKVNEQPNHGIKALTQLGGFTKKIHITNLVFIIAPRVNAAGRMDDGRKAVMMFISENAEEALHWAEQLNADNTNRKEADSSITEEALTIIGNDEVMVKRRSTVLFQPHWHKGVVGIVASRLIEHYYRPTIVLTQSGDYVSGSARSVSGFNVYEAIHQCKDLLLGYGGHYHAAGMTMQIENVDAFSKRFEEVVYSSIKPELLIPEIVIDAEISLSDIRKPLYDIMCQMEPFGPENLRPVFLTKGVHCKSFKILKDAHLRLKLKQNNCTISGIAFNMLDKVQLLQEQQLLDIVYKIEETEWNGEKHLQLCVLDLKPAAP